MGKIDEIKAFIAKNEAVRAELANLMTESSCRYSSHVVEEIIEQQQKLMRQAKSMAVLSVDFPFLEEGEYKVHIRFNEFCKLVDLEACEKRVWEKEDTIYYRYFIAVDNLFLHAITTASSEEHKKAQAI